MTDAPASSPAAQSRPSPLWAFVLGLLAPGLGFVYARRGLFAVGWMLASVAAWGFVLKVAEDDLARMPRAIVAIILGTHIASGVVAGVASALKPVTDARGYAHVWWLIGFFLVSWILTTSLPRQYIDRNIASVVRVPDDHLAPAIDTNALMVIDKRSSALAPRKDNFVAYHHDDAIEIARVRMVGTGASMEDGAGCKVPPTVVPLGSIFVAPDLNNDVNCARYARLVLGTDIIGSVVPAL